MSKVITTAAVLGGVVVVVAAVVVVGAAMHAHNEAEQPTTKPSLGVTAAATLNPGAVDLLRRAQLFTIDQAKSAKWSILT